MSPRRYRGPRPDTNLLYFEPPSEIIRERVHSKGDWIPRGCPRPDFHFSTSVMHSNIGSFQNHRSDQSFCLPYFSLLGFLYIPKRIAIHLISILSKCHLTCRLCRTRRRFSGGPLRMCGQPVQALLGRAPSSQMQTTAPLAPRLVSGMNNKNAGFFSWCMENIFGSKWRFAKIQGVQRIRPSTCVHFHARFLECGIGGIVPSALLGERGQWLTGSLPDSSATSQQQQETTTTRLKAHR